jgi:Ca2+-binding EF-hand superfamily protein
MPQRPPKKSESLEIRLPHATKTAFMQMCRQRGVSASDVLRGCISVHLSASGRADRRKERIMAFLLSPRRASLGAAALLAALAAGGLSLAGRADAAVDPRLAAVFGWIDADRDGRISRAEFAASLAQPPPLGGVEIVVDTRVPPPPGETRDVLFRRLDRNGDGALTLAELAVGAAVRTVLTPAVAAADRDGDGRISEAELAAYLTSRRAEAGITDPAAGVALMVHGIIAARDPDHTGAAPLAELLRG